MEVITGDTNINAALQAALGHPPPFTADECRDLQGPLALRHTSDISILKHCPNLRRLEIFASDIETLDDLSGLESLETLRISCSTVQSIAALKHCHALETVELVLNLVEDASPLMGLPRLKSGSLAGNPWTPESYHEIIPKLLSTPSEAGTRPPLLDFSNEADWQLTRSLYEHGFRASFAHIDTRPVLVKPGPPSIPNADCDFIELPASIIRMDMKRPGFTVDALFKEFIGERGADAPLLSFDFHSHRELGTSADAAAWVRDSSLPTEVKDELMKLVRKFPSLIFYKEDDIFLDRMEAALKVRFPHWFRE